MFLVVQIATACRLVPRRARLQKAALGHEIGRTACGLEDRTPVVSGKLRSPDEESWISASGRGREFGQHEVAEYGCGPSRAASNTRETTDE
jgi:hypothetical protein